MEAIQGYPRFTFGILELNAGFSIIPVLVGTYGLVEILDNLTIGDIKTVIMNVGRVIPYLKDIIKNGVNIVRSGIIGVFIGIIPGVGEIIASYVAYDFAKRSSKHPEKYGKGSIEGLIASETGNNACVGGALVPVLSLAISGSPSAAVLLAALWLHGLRPGPLLQIENPNYIFEFSAMFFYASLAMLIIGLLIVKPLLKILHIKNSILIPIIFLLCTIGTFAINGRLFDIWVMIIFGIIGYPMRKFGYPSAPLVLGLILGPMVDENLRRGLILTNGNFLPFFESTISIILVVAVFLTLFGKTRAVKFTFNLLLQPIKYVAKLTKNR